MKSIVPPPRYGFTLIELLVVISIIAVLAALIFPAFRGIKGRTNQLDAAASLRQLAMGFSGYRTENNGYMPPASFQNQTGRSDYLGWDYFIWPYLGVAPEIPLSDIRRDKNPVLFQQTEKLFYSRNETRSEDTFQGGRPRRTFAMAGNFWTGIVATGNAGPDTASGSVLLTSIPEPSRTLMLTEWPTGAVVVGSKSVSVVTGAGGQISNPNLNPGKVFNYVMVDGHVEALKPADTLNKQGQGGMWTLDPTD